MGVTSGGLASSPGIIVMKSICGYEVLKTADCYLLCLPIGLRRRGEEVDSSSPLCELFL